MNLQLGTGRVNCNVCYGNRTNRFSILKFSITRWSTYNTAHHFVHQIYLYLVRKKANKHFKVYLFSHCQFHDSFIRSAMTNIDSGNMIKINVAKLVMNGRSMYMWENNLSMIEISYFCNSCFNTAMPAFHSNLVISLETWNVCLLQLVHFYNICLNFEWKLHGRQLN